MPRQFHRGGSNSQKTELFKRIEITRWRKAYSISKVIIPAAPTRRPLLRANFISSEEETDDEHTTIPLFCRPPNEGGHAKIQQSRWPAPLNL